MTTEIYSKSQVDAIAAIIGNRITVATDPAALKVLLDALVDTNFMTDAERTKLAGLEPSKFFGTFPNLGAIPTVGAVAGNYAHIDAGIGTDVILANFDVDDDKWVEVGTVSAETATTIKTKYESNADTNVYTDAKKAKLAALFEAADITDFTAALDAAIT